MNANDASSGRTHPSATIRSRAQAFEALGLRPDANPERIRRRFRRLAFLYHPDRNKTQPDATLFKRISQAYRFLTKYKIDDEHSSLNETEFVCHKCNNVAELHTGLDRNRYCRDCLLSIDGRRGLPSPPIVFASLGFATAMLLGSCVTFVLYLWKGQSSLGFTTLLLAIISFVSVAITAITVGLTAQPKRDRRRRLQFR